MGGGHAVRCLTLADALDEAGWRVAFATSPETLDTVPALGESGHERLTVPDTPQEEAAALSARLPGGVALLVVDHYGRDAAFETALRGWARRVLVIDDLADRPHDCDILLDQTAGRCAGRYERLVPKTCRLLLGGEYALLRPQFARTRSAALDRRRRRGGACGRILLSMGAADADNLTVAMLEVIAAAGLAPEVEVDVVLGHAAPFLDEVRAKAAAWPGRISVHAGLGDVADRMARADLAIGAAGTTSWERCCLGLPSLLVVTAENQRDIAAALESRAAAVILEPGSLPVAAAAALSGLAADAERRAAMSRAAAAICDGRGALRAVLALQEPEMADDGRPVTLRLAEPADSDAMLEWQRDRRSRRFSRNSQPPEREEHERWFAARLGDPDGLLAVILHGDRCAGVVRLDPSGEGGRVRGIDPGGAGPLPPGNSAGPPSNSCAGHGPVSGWWRRSYPGTGSPTCYSGAPATGGSTTAATSVRR